MRVSPLHKRRESYSNNGSSNIVSGTQFEEDEEAQLLEREELEFEDTALPIRSPRTQRSGLWSLLRGPDQPHILTIRPYIPELQQSPIRWLEARKFNKKLVLAGVLLLWFLIFCIIMAGQLPIRDSDGNHVQNLDCVDTLWKRKNECGIDGIDCRPFGNQSFSFRCPANCASVRVLNPYTVGPVEYNYRPLVIGTGTYRGDSFICGAAIHAGIIRDQAGGCGRVNLLGDHANFASTMHHGIESIPFDSYFPKSFSISFDEGLRCGTDPRSKLLPFSLIFTAALAIFSASPRIFFPIFTLIFAHVSFASDPPQASYRNITVLPDHMSMFAKRLLPAMFVAVVMYWTTIKRTLSGLTAQFEKAMFWLGGFWIGALSNYTFDWIPISRLTAHDLNQQPRAKSALALIILIIVAIVVGQVFCFWVEGRLPQYLRLYGLFISGILVCLLIPGLNLRIHHYILALLFLPGTSLQTRPSLFYQGILLGLFVNGVARWDFDSVLQTSSALRADAKFDSVIPKILEPTINIAARELVASFAYASLPTGVDGISVLVNDVERDRAFLNDGMEEFHEFEWRRSENSELHEYFRFAYLKNGRTLDYSEAGTLFSNGTWGSGSS